MSAPQHHPFIPFGHEFFRKFGLPVEMAIPQRTAPSAETLREFYVGKDVNDVPKPAVVLDAAKVRTHCRSMLEAVGDLGVGFRFHVKTHKVSDSIMKLYQRWVLGTGY